MAATLSALSLTAIPFVRLIACGLAFVLLWFCLLDGVSGLPPNRWSVTHSMVLRWSPAPRRLLMAWLGRGAWACRTSIVSTERHVGGIA
jgi:hypothetical protein